MKITLFTFFLIVSLWKFKSQFWYFMIRIFFWCIVKVKMRNIICDTSTRLQPRAVAREINFHVSIIIMIYIIAVNVMAKFTVHYEFTLMVTKFHQRRNVQFYHRCTKSMKIIYVACGKLVFNRKRTK